MAKLSSGHAPAFMPIGDGAWVFCQQVTSFVSLNFCQSLCELTKVSIRPQPWGCWKTFHQHHATRHGDVSAPQDLCRRDLNRLWRIHRCSWHIHDQGLDALLLCNEPDALWMAVSRIHGGRLIPMFEVFFLHVIHCRHGLQSWRGAYLIDKHAVPSIFIPCLSHIFCWSGVCAQFTLQWM